MFWNTMVICKICKNTQKLARLEFFCYNFGTRPKKSKIFAFPESSYMSRPGTRGISKTLFTSCDHIDCLKLSNCLKFWKLLIRHGLPGVFSRHGNFGLCPISGEHFPQQGRTRFKFFEEQCQKCIGSMKIR